MNGFLNAVGASGALQAAILVVTIILMIYMLNGRVRKIGKDGITFNGSEIEHFNRLDKMLRAHTETITAEIKSLKDEDTVINKKISDLGYAMNRLQTGQMRQEILSAETPYENKLEVYDAYKKLGGNTFIDDYIDKLRAEHRKETNNG